MEFKVQPFFQRIILKHVLVIEQVKTLAPHDLVVIE